MNVTREAPSGVPVPARKLYTTIVAAAIVGSSLIGVAVGRATSDSGAAVTHTTQARGSAVAGHPVFARRYPIARHDGTPDGYFGWHQG